MCAEFAPGFAPGYGRGDGWKLYCYTTLWTTTPIIRAERHASCQYIHISTKGLLLWRIQKDPWPGSTSLFLSVSQLYFIILMEFCFLCLYKLCRHSFLLCLKKCSHQQYHCILVHQKYIHSFPMGHCVCFTALLCIGSAFVELIERMYKSVCLEGLTEMVAEGWTVDAYHFAQNHCRCVRSIGIRRLHKPVAGVVPNPVYAHALNYSLLRLAS